MADRMAKSRQLWLDATQNIKSLKDPWCEIDFDSLPERKATRQVYNPRTKSWWKDEILIKIQETPFARGAMRECYRMKKLSKFSTQPDWRNASNYVAKCYMSDQQTSVYEQDVQLQMDAKMWGEKYNKRNPPKKVDFFQAYLVNTDELVNGRTLFCVEHFMEGKYIKYNSNSGYISDINRLTPQAFSHFTFEKSGHQLIVVDIQGVGDLYTDPQIHTMDIKDYGEANLGSKGMALYFSSHLCSPLCSALGLTSFDLHDKEISRIKSQSWEVSPTTVVSPIEDDDKPKRLTHKRESLSNVFERVTINFPLGSLPSPIITTIDSPLDSPDVLMFTDHEIPDSVRNESTTEKKVNVSQRSSSVSGQLGVAEDLKQLKEKLVNLGQVHYEMALYHTNGRFTSEPDHEVALFHLHKAADCGLTVALFELGCIYQQLPHYEFDSISVEGSQLNEERGHDYLTQAAVGGSRQAMIIVGRTFEIGIGASEGKNWKEATYWYCQALSTAKGDSEVPLEANYTLLAKMANMYSTGGFNLEEDYQKAGDYYQEAADIAMEEMKGKLANKYYMLAEEAWSHIE